MAVEFVDDHAARAARTYGAAADHYRRPALGFWDRFGATTASRLPLEPGGRVLDLCCGAGASAIPAARAVGPTGHVVAVDVAAPLLDALVPGRRTKASRTSSSSCATPGTPVCRTRRLMR